MKKIESHKIARTVTKANRDAFTLTELMVVIATIGILAAVVLPALAGTKTDSKSFQCMNNLKQLATAWLLYSDESNDRLVNLSTYQHSSAGFISASAPEGIPWRTQIAHMTAPLPAGIAPYTQKALKYLIEMGFKQPTPTIAGPLYAFAPNADVLHCPADWRATLPIEVQPYGGPFAWDSYSGSSLLNGDEGGFTKRSQVLHPAGRFVWIEGDDMRGENLGSWDMNSVGQPSTGFGTAQFGVSPAAFHVATAHLNFCDGHVESHKWQDRTTIAWANDTSLDHDTGSSAKAAADHTGNVDAIWCASHYAGPQNP